MISSTTTKHVYNGNGTTRDWSYTFPINTTDGSDIKLYKTATNGTITEITSNYSINVATSQVTYPTVASGLPLLITGEKITLKRVEPLTQASDWVNQGPFNAETVESALDKTTMILQQQQEELSRSVKYGVDQTPTDTDTSTFLSSVTSAKNDAQTAATNAQNYAAALKATSTSSVAIGTGSKTFTTESGKQFAAGQFCLVVDTANNANYMHGQVTSYSGTTLVVDVQSIGGSGTIASWNIYVSGNRGAQGVQGPAVPIGGVTPVTQAFSDVAAEGTSANASRGDHRHGMPASPGLQAKIGNFSRDTSLASGTQAITGVGFQPKVVIFWAVQRETKEASIIGFDDGVTKYSLRDSPTSAGYYEFDTVSIHDAETVSASYKGYIQSMDSDGFTINWTRLSAPTGTIEVVYLALK